jgi:primary-amine oxidase
LGLITAGALATALPRVAAADCIPNLLVDYEDHYVASFSRTFTWGATWSFDVYEQACQGLVMTSLYYTPKGGSPMKVLARGSLAAFHVPYNDNSHRYDDVTISADGFGEAAHILEPAECPGTAPDGGSPIIAGGRICVHNVDGGIRWKTGNTAHRAESVQIFMASAEDGYDYVNLWALNDDGSISVRTGLTGHLVSTVNELSYVPGFGTRLDKETNATPEVAISHQHNVYYRLDFDIGDAANDRVLKKTFVTSTSASPDSSCSTTGQCGKISYSAITAETKQTWSSSNFSTWVVTDKVLKNADGRNVGYELIPRISGLWRGMTTSVDGRPPSEPWAAHELYVTAYHDCQWYAGHNDSYLPERCAGTNPPTSVVGMIDSTPESVDGKDVVVWYANRFLHYPRDEDGPNMPIEWMAFDLVPRSFYYQNPSP